MAHLLARIEEPSTDFVLISNKGSSDKRPRRVAELLKRVRNIESLESRKSGINEAIKACYDEASSVGFDKAIVKQLIADRKRDQDELELFEDTLHAWRLAISKEEKAEAERTNPSFKFDASH